MNDQNDKEPSWPKWAPKGAREAWQCAEPCEGREVLLRMLTDPLKTKAGMAEAWEWAETMHHRSDREDFDAVMFCIARDCVAAYEGQPVEARHKEIAKTATELQRLIQGTPLADLVVIRGAEHHRAVVSSLYAGVVASLDAKNTQADELKVHKLWRTLGEFLGDIAEEAQALVASGVTVGNAKREEAARLYFVRYLDRKLRELYGSDPARFIVPATTVAFGKFTPSQFYRTVKSQR